MKKYLIIVLIFLGNMTLLAQNTCNIYFETKNSTATSVEIDVKANGFTSVLGFQMYVNWDSTVIRKMSVLNSNPLLPGLSFGASQLGNDIQAANWYDNTGAGVTLATGAVLFTIKYDYSGDPCEQTTLRLTNPDNFRRSLITYSFAEETEYTINFTPANVQIPGTNCGGTGGENVGVGLLIDDVTAPSGSEICVPIRVDSFSQIATLQFSITWDPTLLSYVRVQNNFAADHVPPADDIGTNVINNNTLIYSMATTNPLTIPDGGILIEVCFLVLGTNGQVANIDFSNQIPFEVTNDNGPLPYYKKNGKVTVGVVNNPVTFTVIGVNDAKKDQTVCIDIKGKNFKNIESFQCIVKWDAAVLKWKGLGTVNNIGISAQHISTYGTDGLKISWNDASSKTVADNTTLFQLCFDAIGACKSSSMINIIGEPGFEIEVSSNEILLPHLEIPDTVKIVCDIPPVEKELINVTCNGGVDGRILLTMTGGNVNDYNFKWYKGTTLVSQGDGKNTLIGIGAGTYKVVLTDKSDPTKTLTLDNMVITEPNPQVINQTIVNQTCASKGSISLTVTGNNPPYTYQWNPAAIGNTPNAANLNAGAYAVTVTDSKGCPPVNKSFTITSDITALNLTSQFKDITCKDANDGEITLTVSGGCTPYSIIWSDGLAANQLKRTSLAGGTYKVTVTDSQGQSNEKTFTITNPALSIEIIGTVTEGTNASIAITVTGGSGSYTFSWTGPDHYSSSAEDISNLAKGNYIIKVTDSRGCSETANFTVIGVIDPISVKLTADNNKYNGYGVKCKGDCNGSISATVNANLPYKAYLDNVEITLPYDKVCAGTHTFKIVDFYNKVKDTTFTITEPPILSLVVEEVTCENPGKEDGTILVTVSGGVPQYTYDWGVPGNTAALAENLPKGNYAVSVTDKNGCVVLSQQIKVDNCDKSDCFTGSLILTPNGDGFNDLFLLKCSEDLSGNYLYIYNRLGNEVYKQSDYDGTWNGLDKDGNPLPEDGYLWVFTGKNDAGVREVYKGSLTLLR